MSQAVSIAPDSAAAQHALGLFYVRDKNYRQAIVHLALATEQENASPYYAYVHAVAMENQGELPAAIDLLKKANQRWPNQYEVLMTLVLYLDKADRRNEISNYLSQLSAIAPASPEVRQLIAKYRSE